MLLLVKVVVLLAVDSQASHQMVQGRSLYTKDYGFQRTDIVPSASGALGGSGQAVEYLCKVVVPKIRLLRKHPASDATLDASHGAVALAEDVPQHHRTLIL